METPVPILIHASEAENKREAKKKRGSTCNVTLYEGEMNKRERKSLFCPLLLLLLLVERRAKASLNA
jgi:hypothetical protein